ncbi:MAG: hypothetical protein IJL32_05455 [Oscillospiraceae bacterium]|nr:hypothetical protein [Oscillospiraceae bacterium]
MPRVDVTVENKIASTTGTPEIVCGNNDYAFVFTFDSEWSMFTEKTARFVWCDLRSGKIMHKDVLVTGDVCLAPALYDTAAVAVGVYAGNIHTTTPARIPCARCITDGEPLHEDPDPDIYEQLLQYLEELAAGSSGSEPVFVRRKMYGLTDGTHVIFPITRAMQLNIQEQELRRLENQSEEER